MLAKIKNIVIFLIILNFLSACHTLSSTEHATHNKKETAARINVQLGMAYMERHEIQRAKQKLLTAMREAPQLPEVWYAMGYFFEVTGEKQRAAKCYERSMELAPKRGDTNNNYGTFLCRSHQYKAAIKHFIQATQDMEYLDVASAYENAGLCSELIPEPHQAAKYFEEALKQDPNRATSMLSLAELDFKFGEYEASNSYLDQYLRIAQPNKDSDALAKKLRAKGIRK